MTRDGFVEISVKHYLPPSDRKKLRELGARWDRSERVWEVPVEHEREAEKIIMDAGAILRHHRLVALDDASSVACRFCHRGSYDGICEECRENIRYQE